MTVAGLRLAVGLVACASLVSTVAREGDGSAFHSSLQRGAPTETLLHQFLGAPDGAFPYAGVTVDAHGAVYGTTFSGGTGNCNLYSGTGCGTVFKLTPKKSGGYSENVIYSFQGGNDGSYPFSGVIIDSGGALFGTTYRGGGSLQFGTVYKLTPKNHGYVESIIYNFESSGGNVGALPYAGLVAGKHGELYGTSISGGAHGQGAVYKLTRTRNGYVASLLHSFLSDGQHSVEGVEPYGPLLIDAYGSLYGTTYASAGGGNCFESGCGTAFRLSPTASGKAYTESILYDFHSSSSGAYPMAGLAFAPDGSLIGTTSEGGATYGGVVFDVVPFTSAADSGGYAEIPLHQFGTVTGDGQNPQGGVVFDTSGAMYGTTVEGGSNGAGTIYKLTPSAGGGYAYAVLLNFGYSNGEGPTDTLTIDGTGALYGTTGRGGCCGDGVVFKLTQ